MLSSVKRRFPVTIMPLLFVLFLVGCTVYRPVNRANFLNDFEDSLMAAYDCIEAIDSRFSDGSHFVMTIIIPEDIEIPEETIREIEKQCQMFLSSAEFMEEFVEKYSLPYSLTVCIRNREPFEDGTYRYYYRTNAYHIRYANDPSRRYEDNYQTWFEDDNSYIMR